jgi:hypothetical protein
MLNRRALTSVVVALATTIATQSFAQDRGPGATPAVGANDGATQATFTTSDAIPWKPVDPKHPGFVQLAPEQFADLPQPVDLGLQRSRRVGGGVVRRVTARRDRRA